MPNTFQSLSAQMAETIFDEMRTGTWGAKLPGERQLAKRFNVSRKTAGKALAILRGKGLIQTAQGKASVIKTGKVQSRSVRAGRVMLLLPEQIDQSRPFMINWISSLMGLLHNAGINLELVMGWRYFGRHADRSLQQLVESYPAQCWLIVRSPRPMQQWFFENAIPTVVVGSPHQGIALPSVDLNHRAITRHAAMTFLRLGHRRLAIVFEKTVFGGTIIGEVSFREAINEYGDGARFGICRPEMNSKSIIHEVSRIMKSELNPTAFMMGNSFSYVTAHSYFSSLGLRIPDDLSLISHDEDPFLPFLHPTPSRYTSDSAKYASVLCRAIRRVMDDPSQCFEERVIPDYIKGDSAGPPPADNRARKRI